MSDFNGIKDRRIAVFTDIALFLMSGVAACLACFGLKIISLLFFGMTAALFATVPSTHKLSSAIFSAVLVFAAPITVTLITFDISPALFVTAALLSGFAVSITSVLKLKRIYSVSASAALFAAAAAAVFIIDITRAYGAGFTESFKLFFGQIRDALDGYSESLVELSGVFGTASDTQSYSETVRAIFDIAIAQFELKCVGLFGAVFVVFAFLITEAYKLICKPLGLYDERFSREVWTMNASGAMCAMFVIFSIISFFSVSRYESSSGLTTMQFILVGLANIALIFGAFMLIQGIRKYFEFMKMAKEKARGVYVASLIILIVGILFDIGAMIKLLSYFGALISTRPMIKKGDDGIE